MTDGLVIQADFLIDGSGAPPRPNPEVRIDEGHFEAVRERLGSAGTEDALAYPGCTMIPGLVDSHVHLTMSPDIAAAGVIPDMQTASDSDLYARAVKNAQLALAAGVTTLRDCGGPRAVPMALRTAIDSGAILGPRLLVSGRPITKRHGHCHFMGEIAETEEEIRRATQLLCSEGVDFIKMMVTGGMLTPGSNPSMVQFTPGQMRACVEEAHRLGRRVAGHALCSAGVRASVEAGLDTIEHCWSISGGPRDVDDETVALLARSGVFGSVTAHWSLRSLLDRGPEQIAELRRRLIPHQAMRRAGVPLPVHSDAGVPGTPVEAFYLSVAAFRVGLDTTIEEAVRAATHVPAMALGLGNEIGRIEPGYVGDLVIVRGDPRDLAFSLADVRLVVLKGEVVAQDGRLLTHASRA
jgi:imidazolonepropionase-like amidohydrolase